MADRTITIRLAADVKGLVNGLKTAQQAVKDHVKQTDDWVSKNRDGINTLSNGLMGAGVALTAGFGLAVKKFADFDAAMSAVQAATMTTGVELDSLRQAAIEAGAATQYSASEAAGAIEALAKAGVSTTDILHGGLTGALNLAASAQIDVGTAAEIAATAMNQFGLRGSDASHIADLLAASAGKAMGDVSDMAGALKFVGPVAHQMGVSIEETAGTIALLAQQGILGEQAGTSLRGMLLSLTSPSKVAADQMKQLGIEVYDGAGKFVGLAGVAEQMKTKMANLSDAERDAAFGRMFGNEQVTTARILYAGGAADVQKWTNAVNDSGYAAEQARIKTDNLRGDVERLGGSLDSALIKSGSGANEVLRSMTQSAESMVDAIGKISEPTLSAIALLAGTAGLGALGVGAFGKLVIGISDAKAALAGLNISMKAASLAAGGIGIALGVATIAIATWAQRQAEARQKVEALAATLDQLTGAVTQNSRAWAADDLTRKLPALASSGKSLLEVSKDMGISAKTLTDAWLGNAAAIDEVRAKAKQFADSHPESAIQAAFGSSTGAFDAEALTAALDDQVKTMTDATDVTQQKAQVDGTASDASKELTGSTDSTTSAISTYADAQKSGTATTKDYVDALTELIDAQSKAAGNALSLFDAQTQIEASFADAAAAIKDNGATLDVTTEKGRANRDALKEIASASWDLIDSMTKNGASQSELQASMQSTRDRFIEVASQMGMSADEAAALADQLNLIPGNISVAVAVDTAKAAVEIDQFIALQNGRSITMNIETGAFRVNGTSLRGNAGGGPVVGPGTSTSDSIVRRLSNGEWVIKADSVAKYGHGMLNEINAGTYSPEKNYAQPQRYFPMSPSIAQSGGTSGGTTISAPISIETSDPVGAGIAVVRNLSRLAS